MKSKYLFGAGVLRAPEGEGGSGGGGDGGGDSHEAAAAKLFGGEGGAPGGEGKPPGGDGKPEGKPSGEGKPPAGEGTAPKPGLLGKLGGKKGEAAPAAGAPKPGESENPEDKINLDDRSAPETKTHFASLKGITKQLRGELSARDARIKELETKVSSGTAMPADYEKLKAEHKAFSDRIAVLDLQSHPDFVKQFTEPKTKIVAALNTVLGDNKVEGVDLSSLLHKPRADFMKAANEVAEKLPDYERFEFLAGARQLYQLSQSEREALGQSSELAKNLQAKTLSAQREAFGKTWEKLGGMSEFLLKLEVDATATPEEKASVEAYNKAIDEVRTKAEQLAFSPGGEEGVAQTAAKAASFDFFVQQAFPRIEAEYKQLTELVTKLQDELKQLRGAKGEAGAGGGGGDGGAPNEADMDHASAARKVWRS